MLLTSALLVSALNFGQQGFATIMKREESAHAASSNVPGTFYKLGLTACGTNPLDSDMVVALSFKEFGDAPNPNNSPSCQKCINVVGDTKIPVIAKVQDKCAGCDEKAVDMSEKMFNLVVGPSDVGRKAITWWYVPCPVSPEAPTA